MAITINVMEVDESDLDALITMAEAVLTQDRTFALDDVHFSDEEWAQHRSNVRWAEWLLSVTGQ